MLRHLVGGALLAAAVIPLSAAAAAGIPQRSSETPPGLERVLLKATPGILRALIATEGSNSRLQDVPVSP
jgi:hypothetical protein